MTKIGSARYPARLYERHMQVARMLLSGASNDRICSELGLAQDTVRAMCWGYVLGLCGWFGADNRVHLAMKLLHDARLLSEVME